MTRLLWAFGWLVASLGCGLEARMLGPRPDAVLCLGKDSVRCNYWDAPDSFLACPDAAGTARLDYVLLNAGELPLQYELISNQATDPGFELEGADSGTIAPFGELPFSVSCDSACLGVFATSRFERTSWAVDSNDPRRPKFRFSVRRNRSCRP